MSPQHGPEPDSTVPLARIEAPDPDGPDGIPDGPDGIPDGPDGIPDGPDGIPAARPMLGGLAEDPRMPIWVARAAMSAAAGIAVTIWQDWRLGLSAAALVAIADTIYRSRTTSVIPAGVRVTSAQRRTRRRLLLLRPAGYVSLHSRAIPGSTSVIDHLVIGPAGVFALDSERWDRRLPVRTSTGGLLCHGPFSQKERLDHARWEAAQASRLLTAALREQVIVRPAMAIYGPTIPWVAVTLDGVDVFGGRRLWRYFRRRTRASHGAVRLDPARIYELQDAADQALPPAW